MKLLDEKKNPGWTDEDLLRRSVHEPHLFELLVNKYQEQFVRKVKHILGNRAEVDDIVQDTFTKIYINATRFQDTEGASFKSWGYKILINTTFTYYKKLKRNEEFATHLDEEIWQLIPDLRENDFEKSSRRESVLMALAKLPENLSMVLKLHFLEDKPQKEVADSLGISVSAVKTRIHRAKKELRDLDLRLLTF